MNDIDIIAALITEDPDVVNEMPIRDIPTAIKRRLSSRRRKAAPPEEPVVDPEATDPSARPSPEDLAAAAATKRGDTLQKTSVGRAARMQAYRQLYTAAKQAAQNIAQGDIGTLVAMIDQYENILPEIARFRQPLTAQNIDLKQTLQRMTKAIQDVTRAQFSRSQPAAYERGHKRRQALDRYYR